MAAIGRRRVGMRRGSDDRPIHRIPPVTAWLLVAVVALVITMAAGALVEQLSIGSRSWQQPAVGQTVNGYAGAPVGSQLYLQAGYASSGRPSIGG